MYCFFYVKKSRSSKAEQLYIQVNGIIILYLPILIGSLICGPRQPDHARWCVSYNVYRSVNFFFFHYSIMYYNMYCYHVASIHNQSWTGLLIMETVDQSVSCNLVGVFFFSISMQSFIVQLSEIRNFMISFVITSKYLHVYDKEIFDLKPIGHAFTCHIGIIKSVHIYYCTHVYFKKKVHFECVYESQIMSQLYRGWYSLWPNLWPLFFIGGLWTTRGNGERWLSHGNSKVQYL